jgi:hypothetical protein
MYAHHHHHHSPTIFSTAHWKKKGKEGKERNTRKSLTEEN